MYAIILPIDKHAYRFLCVWLGDLLPSAENKRTIVLAGGSRCIDEQSAHFSVVAFCCIQQGVCEMPVEG